MSAEARHILAIDQSTSATKALVYDLNGVLVDRYSVEHLPIFPRADRVEHDAEQLWLNTRSVLEQAGEKYDALAFIALTNQRETFVIFDRATGRPLHNAVVWQCRRGDDLCAKLMRDGHAEMIAQKTGLKIDSYFSAPKLVVLLEENLELLERLKKGTALFGTIDTYLLYRLTGGKLHATDATNASRTLLFNINTLAWDTDLCRLLGIPMQSLPEVRDSTARFGQCEVAPFQGVPIAGVMGDSQAALFAHRCFSRGEAKMTLGTGTSILLNVGEGPPERGIRTVAWKHDGKPAYCMEGIISYSAATITWLRDQLRLIQSADEVEAAAASVPDNGGVYLVPAFAGLSSPHWAPDARAAIVGLSGASTRNHLIRAALESIAYQIRDALDALQSESGVTPLWLHADGGASRNGFLMQFIADMAGKKVTVSQAPDFSPLGAAMAGMLGMKLRASPEAFGAMGGEEKVFEPRMTMAIADRLHAGWKKAVMQVLAGTDHRNENRL